MATMTGNLGTAISNHPTTAASGLGTSLSIAIMSGLQHANVHLTTEEAMAYTGLICAFFGWFLRFMSARFPVLKIDLPPQGSEASAG